MSVRTFEPTQIAVTPAAAAHIRSQIATSGHKYLRLGVKEVAMFLRGDVDQEGALQMLQKNTRNFAKRQMTWFRHQAPGWPHIADGQEAVQSLLHAQDGANR